MRGNQSQQPRRAAQVPSVPKRPGKLNEMPPVDVAAWAVARKGSLEAFAEHVEGYLSRRKWEGSEHNPTNRRYRQFLDEDITDLLALLDEIREAAEDEVRRQP